MFQLIYQKHHKNKSTNSSFELDCSIFWPWQGLRFFPVNNDLIFYLPNEMESSVTIARIMYGGRDIRKQLSEMYICEAIWKRLSETVDAFSMSIFKRMVIFMGLFSSLFRSRFSLQNRMAGHKGGYYVITKQQHKSRLPTTGFSGDGEPVLVYILEFDKLSRF